MRLSWQGWDGLQRRGGRYLQKGEKTYRILGQEDGERRGWAHGVTERLPRQGGGGVGAGLPFQVCLLVPSPPLSYTWSVGLEWLVQSLPLLSRTLPGPSSPRGQRPPRQALPAFTPWAFPGLTLSPARGQAPTRSSVKVLI